MLSIEKSKLGKFARTTVVLLILIGAARVGIHIIRVISYSSLDQVVQAEESLKNCEFVFKDGEDDRSGDRIQSKYSTPPVPSIVPEGQSRCQTWVKKSQQIGDKYFIWHIALWIIGALIGIATLFIAFSVVRRSTNAGRFMFSLFIVQLVAAVGEVGKAVLMSIQGKKIVLILWPEIENTGHGWMFLYSDIFSTIVIYTFLCIIYWRLARMVGSGKMWV